MILHNHAPSNCVSGNRLYGLSQSPESLFLAKYLDHLKDAGAFRLAGHRNSHGLRYAAEFDIILFGDRLKICSISRWVNSSSFSSASFTSIR